MNIDTIFSHYEMYKSANAYPGGKKGNPHSMLTQTGSMPSNLISQQRVNPQLNAPPPASNQGNNPQSLVAQMPNYADPNQSRLPFGFSNQNQQPPSFDAASRTAPINMPSATMSNPLGYFHNR